MTIIEPPKKDIEHSSKNKKYSASLRFWHWLNMIVISGSLITVLFNSTITDDHSTVSLIQNTLKASAASVNADQAHSAAHALSDSVWDVHIYFGYCLAGLLVFRLILEFFQLADQKFIRRLNNAYQLFARTKKERELALHELTVKAIYAAFYSLLIIVVITGLFLAFEDIMAPLKSIRHSIRGVHGFCMSLIIAFIVVHLAGVFLAERKDAAGIVSDMINGGKEQ